MNELFIHAYLDEDVSTLIAALLRSRGFQATTTAEAEQLGSSDARQLAYAASRQLTLISHNWVDFETLARQYIDAGRSHAGIIVAVRRSPYEIARRILMVTDTISREEMRNQLLYI